ncbi:hypothetical protein HaLaN_08277 [Haematococcus lacustris]|uniref:Uncharacterized protein n=1 Tax=Haematococcus lacustris TaxID=44745 RepID=A0A699YTK1_HAELA|nr:hypothetical protein HaLaN_08277 [Haematococcus lacustris]
MASSEGAPAVREAHLPHPPRSDQIRGAPDVKLGAPGGAEVRHTRSAQAKLPGKSTRPCQGGLAGRVGGRERGGGKGRGAGGRGGVGLRAGGQSLTRTHPAALLAATACRLTQCVTKNTSSSSFGLRLFAPQAIGTQVGSKAAMPADVELTTANPDHSLALWRYHTHTSGRADKRSSLLKESPWQAVNACAHELCWADVNCGGWAGCDSCQGLPGIPTYMELEVSPCLHQVLVGHSQSRDGYWDDLQARPAACQVHSAGQAHSAQVCEGGSSSRGVRAKALGRRGVEGAAWEVHLVRWSGHVREAHFMVCLSPWPCPA